MKYVDYKATIWGRLVFEENADLKKVIEILKTSHVSEICKKELGFKDFFLQYDTEEYVEPVDENDITIYVFSDESGIEQPIWDNSIK